MINLEGNIGTVEIFVSIFQQQFHTLDLFFAHQNHPLNIVPDLNF